MDTISSLTPTLTGYSRSPGRDPVAAKETVPPLTAMIIMAAKTGIGLGIRKVRNEAKKLGRSSVS